MRELLASNTDPNGKPPGPASYDVDAGPLENAKTVLEKRLAIWGIWADYNAQYHSNWFSTDLAVLLNTESAENKTELHPEGFDGPMLEKEVEDFFQRGKLATHGARATHERDAPPSATHTQSRTPPSSWHCASTSTHARPSSLTRYWYLSLSPYARALRRRGVWGRRDCCRRAPAKRAVRRTRASSCYCLGP